MQVLLNDFRAMWADVGADALEAVDRVGRSGYLILGEEVARFERDLAALFGLERAVGCANGLDAIEMGLRALGLKPGQKVLTTPLSAYASSLAILRAGGQPCFVDVDGSGLMDLGLAEQALKNDSSIRFMVPVHLYGHALDLDRLEALRDRFSLSIVEDCAQAIGARSRGRSVGSVGQAAALSLYPTKNLGCFGDGGALLCRSEDVARAARAMRDYGQTEKYVHSQYGMNSRLDELQAGLLNQALLPRLKQFTAARVRVASLYAQGLRSAALELPAKPAGSESAWHLFPVIVASGQGRARLQAHLREKGVHSAIHYPRLIPEQEAFPSALATPAAGPTGYPNARRFCERELSLPMHPYLSDADVRRVVEACNEWN